MKPNHIKKELVTVTIAVHPIQAKIITALRDGKIDVGEDSLRDIAEKIGEPSNSPQNIKHHLEQLLNLGVIQKIYGSYAYEEK